jgi:hypothetical protein
VTYEIRDSTGTATLGYVAGGTFLSDDIRVKDAATDADVAHLTRRHTALSAWVWRIDVLDESSELSDLRLLSVMAGTQAFDDGTQDSCNAYFRDVAFAFIAVGVLGVLALGVAAREWCRARQQGGSVTGKQGEPLLGNGGGCEERERERGGGGG